MKSKTRDTINEIVWLCICLVLFCLLGPFCVPAVFYGMYVLSKGKNMSEPETLDTE